MFDQKKSPLYSFSSERAAAASQFVREQDYWLKKFSGQLVKTVFPYDHINPRGISPATQMDTVSFDFTGTLWEKTLRLSSGSNIKIHMILTAALLVLIHKHTGNTDIIIGSPIYHQETEGEFLNTVLTLRNRVKDDMTFKELLLQVRKTIVEADENQNYPIEGLLENLDIQSHRKGFPLFGIVLMLENIHNKKYIHQIYPYLDMIFSFHREENTMGAIVSYNPSLYYSATVKRVTHHFKQLLKGVLADAGRPFSHIDILSEEERKQLLIEFNDTDKENRFQGSIPGLFEEQVARTPDHTALLGQMHLSYRELNEKSNQLAWLLRKNGVAGESVVGIMIEPSPGMVIGLMAILKAGGAYLPIDPGLPAERVGFMLEDSHAVALVTTHQAMVDIPFTELQGFWSRQDIQVTVTPARLHIEVFDQLPRPDRSLIDLRNYKNKIGMASVTDCISVQSTRGCPYQCLYCHKIWSKHHVHRSAENLYHEIEYYYKNGVTNFAFIDDCFNLNSESSKQLFRSIIKNKLKMQFFFPNGLRGDIMTADYIDLMVEAGTRGINLSLETASPRLQKLLKKNLDLEKFKQVMDYIATRHPHVILEMASMHGFPGETEEEAHRTLDFIKRIKWIHFPYIHILKIFPNTEMEAFALEQGISKEAIMKSKDRAFHELPETLPFPKSFTRKYQADFLNNYFLNKDRLTQVLPHQMKVLSETALVQKYNAYLPVEIKQIEDLIEFTQLQDLQVPDEYRKKEDIGATMFDWSPERGELKPGAKKILLLDLSQHFSSHRMLYRVVEQPLGLIYLLTHLKAQFGDKIDGRIYKSGDDFDSFAELKALVDEYRPDLVGVRTLTFFKEFFHETVSLLRQWGVKVPIITGGPYASSDYDTILKDKNVNLVVLGEGEYTLEEFIREMFKRDFQLPGPDILAGFRGIAYAEKIKESNAVPRKSRQVILLDHLKDLWLQESMENLEPLPGETNLAYVMYTSGSTGKPKGVMVEHGQVNNCISWMQDKFNLGPGDVIVNRTNLTFDPSVWEIFWPLYIGGSVKVLDRHQRKDAEFLLRLMTDNPLLTMMYCPSPLVNIMTYLLNGRAVKPRLRLPWLIIGAESISMETVKNFYRCYDGKIVNTYGPTECTINNTYFDLEPSDNRSLVPIGKPVANNKIYIVDRNLRLVPPELPGEICIAGSSVARGYINQREKTQLAFIENPFGQGKLYKTGDIGRWLEDGNIEIMGRLDEQVKIRGYRIELGEIENLLLRHPEIKDCVAAVKDNSAFHQAVKTCKKCGITTTYPNVTINETGICNICENYTKYKKYIDDFFKTLDDLKQQIIESNRQKRGKYDCLLLFNGGRGSAYALYQLKDMGFKALTFSYDNGYFSKADLGNIKAITTKLGVDHVVFTHKASSQILKESIKAASTVCRGCFHVSFALAAEYAYKNNIYVVVGATLSRGQIIENKLLLPLGQGITDIALIEKEIANIQRSAPGIDKTIFDYIDIDVVKNGTVYQQVTFLDFYRYCDITNQEMIAYLDNRDSYWKRRKNYAIYSTNCPIKQIGDYGHLQEKNYHYYGAATSWEKRLGHITLENLKQDLKCTLNPGGYKKFLKRIGYHGSLGNKNIETNDKYLCAYVVYDKSMPTSNTKPSAKELRDYLSGQLPDYMIPSYFEELENIPLTPNGKVDKRALPEPKKWRSKVGGTYVAPKSDMEKIIANIWKQVLHLDAAGVDDNFFDLGGSSLDIVMMGSRLKEEIHRDIPVVTLFTYPTIHSLARHLGENNPGDSPAVKEIDRSEVMEKGKNMMKQAIKKIGIKNKR